MRLPPLPAATRIGAAIAAAGLVLLVALMWFLGVDDRRQGHEREFRSAAASAAHIVETRLSAEARMLNGLRAFLLSSTAVTPEEWASYVRALDLPRVAPGTLAIGQASRIGPAEAISLTVIDHTAIDRPAAGRSAVGTDLAADAIHRATIEQSMTADVATLSPPAPRLAGDGMAMMMVLSFSTASGGMAGAVFSELDLARALPDLGRLAARGVILTLADTAQGTVLYRGPGENNTPLFGLTRIIEVNGRQMTLDMRSTAAADAAYRAELMRIGLLCSGTLLLAAGCLAAVLIALRRASVERLKDFAASAADWFWETDAGHRIAWVSSGIEASLGRKAEWYVGRDGISLGSRADSEATRKLHKAVAALQPFRDIEYVRTTPNGRRRIQISALPRFDAAGRFLGYRGVGRDVTALRRYQARLRDALASLTEACLLFDDEGRLIASNLPARRLFAPYADDIRRQPSLAEVLADIAAVFETPEDWDGSLALPLPASRRVTLRQRSSCRRFDLGIDPTTEGGVVMLFVDVTAFEREQAALTAALARAEAAHRAKSIFLANMSHELRTPLNAILGFSEIMMQEMFGPLGNERYRDYARTIHGSGSHLLALITNILEMSRLEAGKRDLQPTPLRLADSVAGVLALLDPLARHRGITLVPGEGPAGTLVRADPLALRQILINVLGNAVKFAGNGGRITVAWTVRETMVETAITDDGPGIPPDLLGRLGRPFESGQAGRSDVAGSGGTGLGLAISRDLAQMQGGRLAIASTPGAGTTVTLTLPLAGSEQDHHERQEQEHEPR
jgi:PAS domain S-box-containing protein